MIKEDFKIVIQGKKINDDLLVDMSTDYIFTEPEAMAVVDTVLTSMVNGFDYTPIELMLNFISNHYSLKPEGLIEDIDRLLYGHYQEECLSRCSLCV